MNSRLLVRSTRLELVRVSPHAPQTCAYADSATTAGCCLDSKDDYSQGRYSCQGIYCGNWDKMCAKYAEICLNAHIDGSVMLCSGSNPDGKGISPDIIADIQVAHCGLPGPGACEQNTADGSGAARGHADIKDLSLG